jgi:hypothetical protein
MGISRGDLNEQALEDWLVRIHMDQYLDLWRRDSVYVDPNQHKTETALYDIVRHEDWRELRRPFVW